jgi:hypothetical protein
MDETKLYSWFPGPKAENADLPPIVFSHPHLSVRL